MSLRTISLAEVRQHTTKSSCWVIIHNGIYDVTKFLEEHPGGEDSLLDVAGKDGTGAFEDVGHSDDAKDLMQKYKIGILPTEDSFTHRQPCCAPRSSVSLSNSARSVSQKSIKSLSERSRGAPCSNKSLTKSTSERSIKSLSQKSRSCNSRTSIKSTPSVPKIERRVSTIIVPYGSNWWKYALAASAAALIIGFVIYKRR